jgi:hypothetical protein
MKPLTKVELLRQIQKFLLDADRGISMPMFAELCGISLSTLKTVYLYQTEPLTEVNQIRVNKGYEAWKKGEVRVMKRKDNTRFVDYRKVAEPKLAPSMGLKISGGQIRLRVGMVNPRDYSNKDLDKD